MSGCQNQEIVAPLACADGRFAKSHPTGHFWPFWKMVPSGAGS